MLCIYCTSIPRLPEEEFRPVPGFEDRFFVSNLGRIIRHSCAKTPTPGSRNACGICKPGVSNCGYLMIRIRYKGCVKRMYVHQVVLAAFFGPRPDGYQVNHISGLKVDNAATNLEYVTPSENMKHAYRLGLHASGDMHPSRLHPERVIRGESHPRAKLSESSVREIRRLREEDKTMKDIAQMFGVSRRSIGLILKGKNWRHVT